MAQVFDEKLAVSCGQEFVERPQVFVTTPHGMKLDRCPTKSRLLLPAFLASATKNERIPISEICIADPFFYRGLGVMSEVSSRHLRHSRDEGLKVQTFDKEWLPVSAPSRNYPEP